MTAEMNSRVVPRRDPAAGVVEPPLRDPSDLRLRDLRLAAARIVKEVGEIDLPGLAAGVAFKIFLALFPAILAAAAIYGLVSTRAEVFASVRNLSAYLPTSAAELIGDNLRTIASAQTRTAGLLAVFGVLVGLIAATGAAASLMRALNRIYGISDRRRFLPQRLVGLAMALALFLALASLAVLIVAGGTLQDLLLPERLQIPLITVPLGAARLALSFLVLVALFGFVYSVGPNRVPPQWQWLSPGAVVGVVGWLLVAGGFRLYTVTIGASTYDQASYGTIGGVIVLMLWLQLSMLAMLGGAELNAELERIRRERAAARGRALGAPVAPPPAARSEVPTVAVGAPGPLPRNVAVGGLILTLLALAALLRRALAR